MLALSNSSLKEPNILPKPLSCLPAARATLSPVEAGFFLGAGFAFGVADGAGA